MKLKKRSADQMCSPDLFNSGAWSFTGTSGTSRHQTLGAEPQPHQSRDLSTTGRLTPSTSLHQLSACLPSTTVQHVQTGPSSFGRHLPALRFHARATTAAEEVNSTPEITYIDANVLDSKEELCCNIAERHCCGLTEDK